MGVYHVRVLSSAWLWTFGIYVILTILIAVVVLIALLGLDMDWDFNVFALIFLLCYVYSIYLLWRLSSRDTDITIFEDRIHIVLAKVSFIKNKEGRDIYFKDIVQYKYKITKEYRAPSSCSIILMMTDHKRYKIDPSLRSFRKIDDYSTLNFDVDFLKVFKKYCLKNNSEAQIIIEDSSRLDDAVGNVVDLADLAQKLDSFNE